MNGVNLMNMVYVANGKKVKRSKGQKVKCETFRKKRWVDASFLIIVDASFLNILV